MILEMVASRKHFRTNDAVSRLFSVEDVRMILPDVSDANAEAVTLGEAEVAAEHGLGAPVLLRGVTVGWCLEPGVNSTKITLV